MKKNIILFIIIIFIQNIFTLIPLWNFKNSSINLFSSSEDSVRKIISSKTLGTLTKKISRSGDKLKEENKIVVIDENEVSTKFEGLDSVYYVDHVGHFVCPTGKNHLNQYDSNDYHEIKPNNFIKSYEDYNWELKCVYNKKTNCMLVTYLNQAHINKIFALNLNDYKRTEKIINWSECNCREGFFDFVLSQEPAYGGKEEEYNMFGLILIDSSLYLQKILLTINNDITIYYNDNNLFSVKLSQKSKYMRSYFLPDNTFSWMSLNTTKDFKSGFCTEKINPSNVEINTKNIHYNNDTPFYFLNDVEIKKMDMIRNTRFAYYEILYNKTNGETYRGIIDLKLNKIIFNTNENIQNFKPLTNYSMLAFINGTAYEICAIKDKNGCVEDCPNGIILDAENGNHCKNEDQKTDENLFILKPYDIYIKSCDNGFYAANKNKGCGLCKDLYKDDKLYKIINETDCISEKPNNTYYINKDLKILGYCGDNCLECSSFDVCTKCNDNSVLNNGKCNNKGEGTNIMIIIFIIFAIILILLIVLFILKNKYGKKDDDFVEFNENNRLIQEQ